MSSTARIGRPAAWLRGRSRGGPVQGRPARCFTSRRSAAASMCILAVVVALLVVDLVGPLLR